MQRVFVAIFLLAGVCAKVRYDGHKLISVYSKTPQDVDFLHSLENQHDLQGLDFWTQPSTVRPTDIHVSPSDFDKLRELLTNAGIEFKVVKENIQADIDIEDESIRRTRTRNSAFCNVTHEYCTFEEIEVLLNAWETANPNNMEIDVMNWTHEGRPIYMVSIFQSYSDFKPAVIVEAGTHAREWISVSSGLVLIEELLSGSARAQDMLAKYDWYIVPVHNPDGYAYSFIERLWRKNRAPCYGIGPGVGIDLNRNWDVSFGGAGTSPYCSSDIYRGQKAFEAVETYALKEALKTIKSLTTVKAFFSIHSYSQLMLVPFAYTSLKPLDYEHLMYVATEMMDALYQIDQRYFEVGTPPDILYAATGGAYDYFYLEGVTYSFTYELRPATATPGFILPPEEIWAGTAEFMASIARFVEMDL